MKIYIVKDQQGVSQGSRSKKVFTRLSHIKTSILWPYILVGDYKIYKYDLSRIVPIIIEPVIIEV